jgi:tRNA(His) guanylyltransferase
MKLEELDLRMRTFEPFRSLHIQPGAWTIIRLDGRAFTRFTAHRFAKPFDENLRDAMIEASISLLRDFQGIYAFTFSDEISVVFAPNWKIFSGRIEKLVSVSAGLVSATFTRACAETAHFDSRIWQSEKCNDVIDYFRWRQSDTTRCALHGWCYWKLRQARINEEEATRLLAGRDSNHQKNLLSDYGIDFDQVPLWQRRGIGLYWQSYEKPGYDPVKHEAVLAQRRKIKCQLKLPSANAYSELLQGMLKCL